MCLKTERETTYVQTGEKSAQRSSSSYALKVSRKPSERSDRRDRKRRRDTTKEKRRNAIDSGAKESARRGHVAAVGRQQRDAKKKNHKEPRNALEGEGWALSPRSGRVSCRKRIAP